MVDCDEGCDFVELGQYIDVEYVVFGGVISDVGQLDWQGWFEIGFDLIFVFEGQECCECIGWIVIEY